MAKPRTGMRAWIRSQIVEGIKLPSHSEIAERFGSSSGSVKTAVHAVKKHLNAAPSSSEQIEDRETDNARHLSSKSHRIKTPEELIRACNIDLTGFDIVSKGSKKWDIGAKGADGQIITEELYSTFVTLKPNKAQQTLLGVKDQLLKELQKYSPKSVKIPKLYKPKDNILVLSIPDLHFGKLAVTNVSGEDYNMDIAEERFLAALSDLLTRAAYHKPERIYLIFNGDTCHIDNLSYQTTAGTPQDCDGLYINIYQRTREILVKAIEITRKYATVEVKVMRGNHDWQNAISINDALYCMFKNQKDVVIDNSAAYRKYVHYGVSLLGFTHGDQEKPARLPMLMPQEAPKLWAKSKQRMFFTGHFHRRSENKFMPEFEEGGVLVKVVSSLSGTDHWHNAKGFLGMKAAQGFIFNKERGLLAMMNSPIN